MFSAMALFAKEASLAPAGAAGGVPLRANSKIGLLMRGTVLALALVATIREVRRTDGSPARLRGARACRRRSANGRISGPPQVLPEDA
jgi:hypothetical protein